LLLGAIFSHEALKADWFFQGGTCLKKCYFETYRFSEDLDFTLRNPGHLKQEFLIAAFYEIADWIYEQSGIELSRYALAIMVLVDSAVADTLFKLYHSHRKPLRLCSLGCVF
jgi:hypothetical protein